MWEARALALHHLAARDISEALNVMGAIGGADPERGVPIKNTWATEPPALAYVVKHRHSTPSLLEPVLPWTSALPPKTHNLENFRG